MTFYENLHKQIEPATIGLRLLPCPRRWALESLLVALFLCLPLGIVAMVYSSKVESRYAVGRYDEAAVASARARSLCIAGACVGAVVWTVGLWLVLTGTLRVPNFILTI